MVQRDKNPDTDDVVGHMPFRKSFTDEVPDDAEGHGVRSGRAHDEADDAEGHALKSGRATDETDDTEGHGVRVRF